MLTRKYIGRLLVFTCLAYAAVKATTIGWNFMAPVYPGRAAAGTSPEKLKAAVTALASGIGPRDLFNNNRGNLRKTEAYITSRLRAAGYKTEYQEYLSAGVKVKNIIASRRGTSAPGEIILIGAHYDTFDNPGADDNSSGVAGLLELAEYAAKNKFSRTVKFTAFVNEEPPFFRRDGMGSAVYAKAAAGGKEDIKAALIMEMVGYYTERRVSQRYPPLIGPFFPGRGNFIAQISNFSSRKLAARSDRAFRTGSALPLRTISLPSFVPGVDYSDHRSFWRAGYPAVMFTDTAFYRNTNYHKRSDLPATLNYEYMAAFLDGMKAVVDDLAGKTCPPDLGK